MFLQFYSCIFYSCIIATGGRTYYRKLLEVSVRQSVSHSVTHVTLLPCSYLHNRWPDPCQNFHTCLPNYNLQGPPEFQGPPGPWGTPRCKNITTYTSHFPPTHISATVGPIHAKIFTQTPCLPNYNLQGPPEFHGPPGPWGTPRCKKNTKCAKMTK